MPTYLISEQSLKDQTILNENVDPKLLGPAILESQDINLQDCIGTSLYYKLQAMTQAEIDTAGASVNVTIKGNIVATTKPYQLLLLRFIQPCLKYYVLSRLTFDMCVKYVNKAIVTRGSENSFPISFDNFGKVREEKLNTAETYAMRMKEFLSDNPTIYPEYGTATGTGLQVKGPNKSSYTSGMFLGSNDHECDYDR